MPRKQRKTARRTDAASSPKPAGSRFTAARLRYALVGALVLGAGGWAVAAQVQSHRELHDLSVVGTGIPAAVQIFDHQCSTCYTLKDEVIAAAKGFDKGDLIVRVANLATADGRALAERHAVPNMTVIMLDGDGELRQVLRGPSRSDYLSGAFSDHLRAIASGRPRNPAY